MTIRAVVADVDGVLTDGTVWIDEDGRETKRIAFADIMGASIGRRSGLKFALVSGESGPTLEQIAAKFSIEDVYGGCKDKGAALRDFAARHSIDLAEICYIGDDVNDVPALEIAGLPVAPGDARAAALSKAEFVTSQRGGRGALRDVVDYLLGEGAADRRPRIDAKAGPDGGSEDRP